MLLQELIKDQVADMYLWPKRLEVQIMDPIKYITKSIYVYFYLNLYKTILISNVTFHRAMQRPVGSLNVKVVRASKLKKKDLLGSSDPYVVLEFADDRLSSKQTSVKKNNLNPEWNEEFTMAVKDPQTQDLIITLYDWEKVLYILDSSYAFVKIHPQT